MSIDILLASGNSGKIAEFRKISEGLSINFLSPKELQKREELSAIPEVDESADTYLGNAELKARAFARWGGIAALADDSGLAVDILSGRPGVHSARYGGEGLNDLDRCRKLVEEIHSIGGFNNKPVTARFHCSLVLALPDSSEHSVEITFEGEVVDEFLGDKGFGYDPVVYVPSIGRSLAELSFEEVCKIGFRAKAFSQLSAKLPELFSRLAD